MNPKTSTRRRIEWLDSIRGLAALAVLFNHSLGIIVPPAGLLPIINFPIISIIHDDRTAVTMFFVLSGFVLSLPWVRREDGTFRKINVLSFYIRRVTRIWIPWLAVFLVSWMTQANMPENVRTTPPRTEESVVKWKGDFSRREILKQLYYGLNQKHQLLPQDWSLGVELKGSFLMPLFLFLLRKQVWALIAAAVGLLFLYPTGMYYYTFAVGVLLAAYSGAISKWFRGLSGAKRKSLLALGLILYNARYWNTDWQSWDKTLWTVAAGGCALILISSMGSDGLQSFLSRRFFVFIGRISYSIYLLQFLILLGAVPWVIAFLNKYGFVNRALCFGVSWGTGVLITVLLSVLTFRWIEIPSMNLGQAISKWIDRSAVAAAECTPSATNRNINAE
jgi:peptidoglycan/LPS O-acetylase OafA/YrhL